MATVIITVTDNELGLVNIVCDYDPPVDTLDAEQTNAQLMVSRMLLILAMQEAKIHEPDR